MGMVRFQVETGVSKLAINQRTPCILMIVSRAMITRYISVPHHAIFAFDNLKADLISDATSVR